MKQLVIARIAAAASLVSLAAGLVPMAAHGQTTVNANWVQVSNTGPAARGGAGMVYDSARQRSILFGGSDGSGSYFSDTWQYDGNDWTQVSTAHAPAARRGHAIAYDPARGVTVLFGGQSSVNLNDTWEFNGVDWTQVAPASSPSERIWPAMAYDPNLGGTVMFGGAFGSNYNPLNDTWLYAEGGWQQIAPQVNLSARFYSASAYESNRGDFVLF